MCDIMYEYSRGAAEHCCNRKVACGTVKASANQSKNKGKGKSEDWFRMGARLMGTPNYDGRRDLALQTYREMTGHVPSASEDLFAT